MTFSVLQESIFSPFCKSKKKAPCFSLAEKVNSGRFTRVESPEYPAEVPLKSNDGSQIQSDIVVGK